MIRFQFDETRISIQPEKFYAAVAIFCALFLAAVVCAGTAGGIEFYRLQPLLILPILAATFAFGDAGAAFFAGVVVLSGAVPIVVSADAPRLLYAGQTTILCLIALGARQIVAARHDRQIQHYNVLNHQKGEVDFLAAQVETERTLSTVLRAKAGQWERLDGAVHAVTASLFPERVLEILMDETRGMFSDFEISIDLKTNAARDSAEGQIIDWIVDRNETILIPDLKNDFRFRHLDGIVPFRSFIGVPILEEGAPVGALSVSHTRAGAADMDHLRLLYKFSEIAGVILRNADIYKKTDHLGRIDGLTGLYKRWYLQTRLDELSRFARRNASPLTVIMSDIDFFKSVNDRFGHQEGDRVLKTVGEIFCAAFEERGITARYGGEEFIAVVPQIPAEEAGTLAESYRSAVAACAGISVTVSCGVATYPDSCADPDRLIDFADRALYRAKESGRNRVVTADVEKSAAG